MDQMRVKIIFHYDELTGEMLYKDGRKRHIAGKTVLIKGKKYHTDHLIWLLHHGRFPDKLKYRDEDKSNSRIENLYC